jgi:hypothetical protein
MQLKVRRIMLLVAALGLLFALGRYLVLGDRSIPLELTNQTDHPIHAIEISYPGGVIQTDRLDPGESVRGRAWPTAHRYNGGFLCRFGIRHTNGDGQIVKRNLEAHFDPTFVEPYCRGEYIDFGGGKEGFAILGMGERPTSQIRKYFRTRIP